MRTIIIGDVHGCAQELADLVDALDLRPDDRVVALGDFLDKGPDPLGCIRLARTLGFESVLGNHEEKALRWLRHEQRARQSSGYRNPMKSVKGGQAEQWAQLNPDDVAWLQSLPLWIRSGDWAIVHAGLMPGLPLDLQLSNCLRIRWLDESDRMVALDPENPVQPPASRWWMDAYDGCLHVAYGHSAHHLSAPRIDRNNRGAEMWGLDTGCVFGGRLTALVLETREVIQVPARTVYVTPPVPIPG